MVEPEQLPAIASRTDRRANRALAHNAPSSESVPTPLFGRTGASPRMSRSSVIGDEFEYDEDEEASGYMPLLSVASTPPNPLPST
eukprot:6394507-Amphidinium_carterae.1